MSGWLTISVYGALLGLLYNQALVYLFGMWRWEDFNYGYVILPIVLYLLWEKRDELKIPSILSWGAFFLLGAGIGLYVVGELGGEFTALFLSLWLVVVGLCWMHLGWRKLKVIGFSPYVSARDVPAASVDLPVGFGQGMPIRISRAFIEKNGARLLTYYWFPQRGRVLNNMFQLKTYAFWDALTSHRTDGALVRLMTPVYEGERQRDADRRLTGFAGQVVPILDTFLPKGG